MPWFVSWQSTPLKTGAGYEQANRVVGCLDGGKFLRAWFAVENVWRELGQAATSLGQARAVEVCPLDLPAPKSGGKIPEPKEGALLGFCGIFLAIRRGVFEWHVTHPSEKVEQLPSGIGFHIGHPECRRD